jgi:biotin carboxylase
MHSEKSALILGGGSDQKLLIEEFNRRGIETIVIDYYPNPPGKSVADIHYQESTYDEKAIREIALKHKVNFITTISTDQPLLIAAKVSEELGLHSYITGKQALSLTNKSVMKDLMFSNNIPTASYKYVTEKELAEIQNITSSLQYPLIVKPVDSSGSRGINKVFKEKDLMDCINKALAVSREKKAIIEEFIDGLELSVDCFVSDAASKVIMISENHKWENFHIPIIHKSLYPSSVSNDIKKDIEDICQKLSEAFGLKNSPLFVQMMVKDNKVYVIELSARIAGGSKPVFIKEAKGIDIVKTFADLIVDKKVKPDYDFHVNNNVTGVGYLYCKNDKISGFSDIQKLKNDKLFIELMLYRSVGDTMKEIKDTSSRVGAVMINAKDNDEFEDKFDIFKRRFQVYNENGENILLR